MIAMTQTHDFQISQFLRRPMGDNAASGSSPCKQPYFGSQSDGIRLSTLLESLETKRVDYPSRQVVRALVWDSRQVVPGSVFFAIEGEKHDGHRFIPDAIARGAVAVVSENSTLKRNDITTVIVENTRVALARMALRFYDHPDQKLNLFGVTGTNGKTTVSRMIQYMVEQKGAPCGLIGTIEYALGGRVLPAHRTTPEVDEVCALLSEMVTNGCRDAVMEVSSHGISQHRVHGLSYKVLAFLNLTPEHLDYHSDMEAYYRAKASVFKGASNSLPLAAVINVDDPYGVRLWGELDASVRKLSVGISEDADFRAENIEVGRDGTSFDFCYPGGRKRIRTPLLGDYNVLNILAAVACVHLSGKPVAGLLRKIQGFSSVPGRLERVDAGQSYLALVDYAHTPDALEKVLTTLRGVTEGRLLVVFGCGGDRDREKRPIMMQIACRLADWVCATSDNPRSEDQSFIFEEMLAGAIPSVPVVTIADREDAIAAAAAEARPGDTLVVAGKGHEAYQIFANTIVPFDDRTVLKHAINACADLETSRI